ncbi:protein SLOW GREEN 1, chloroplastic-like [Malania oleifera]|uniref:protein SLOW GREEN 1, chloroplastic-like n=1 Tax=Malania oleifera TaxID=397392 RepID=UPI0025AEBE48|nr:protein SLOW GREEN 1, chloroplastic-like [Malania oleifera]XP_057970785.1 protein SLOW GREEN 1, chloroplastic-like [Malania oleifera]
MEALAKLRCSRQQPLPLPVHHHRASFSGPISSVSLRTPSSSSNRLRVIRASSFAQSSSSDRFPQNPNSPKTPFSETLSPLFKTTCIAIAAAALFWARSIHKPIFAAPVATVEPTKESTNGVADEEKEKTLEEYLVSHPDDVDSLRSLMELKIKSRKINEAIDIIDRLITIEPDEREWPLMKAHIHIYSGDAELAKMEFEEILERDPLRVEAYHGLVMAQSESGGELNGVIKRIDEAMQRCKKEKKRDVVREFKLLIAQVKVIEGNYTDALKVYQELVKEEPRDFRPYLCQGIIYTLLRKKDEAEKQFQKYRRLVPKGHPYAQFFDDNMIATRVFSQMAENQRAGSNR